MEERVSPFQAFAVLTSARELRAEACGKVPDKVESDARLTIEIRKESPPDPVAVARVVSAVGPTVRRTLPPGSSREALGVPVDEGGGAIEVPTPPTSTSSKSGSIRREPRFAGTETYVAEENE